MDLEDDDDEDEVVVLKDSELYNHLSNFCPNTFSTYEKSLEEFHVSHQVTSKSKVLKVPKEYLQYTDALLNSSILLDDDASYLYNFTTNLMNTNHRDWLGFPVKLSLIGILSVAPIYVGWLNTTTVLDLFEAVKNQWINRYRLNKLNGFILILKKIHFYIKKMVQIINEENAYHKLQEIKLKTDENCQDYLNEIGKKKNEVRLLSDILKSCICDHIRLSRSLILDIRIIKPLLFVDNADFYLAYSTDDQLGLVAVESSDNCDSIESSGNTLEVIKNVYLLMQSELFRRLGLCFCPSLWIDVECNFLDNLFDKIDKYTRFYSNVYETIFFYYQKHLFPESIRKSKKSHEITEGYNILHRLNKSLGHLVSDARVLEDYIENRKDVSGKFILKRIEGLKREMNDCMLSIQNMEKFYVKSIRSEKRGEETRDDKVGENDETRNGSVIVGATNLAVRSEDGVFFGITDGAMVDGSDRCNDGEETTSSAQFPDCLMAELRHTLVSKRLEFDKREREAVGDSRAYREFLEAADRETANRGKKEEAIEGSPPLDESQFNLQKMLASSAALRGRLMVKSDEECFGSTDEEEEITD